MKIRLRCKRRRCNRQKRQYLERVGTAKTLSAKFLYYPDQAIKRTEAKAARAFKFRKIGRGDTVLWDTCSDWTPYSTFSV